MKPTLDIARRVMLFFFFPEAGFRKEVQEKKITKTKMVYAAIINFAMPLLFLVLGLIINANEPLKQQVQTWQDTGVTEKIDDYGRYAPIPFIFILDRCGIAARSPFGVRVALFATSYIIGDAIVFRTKQATQVQRPKAEYGTTSFPSQHTNQAFLASMTLHHEYIGSKGGGVVSAAGMFCAAGVGYLRYARDKHWSSDVLVGAAVGMITVNMVYMFLYGLLSLLMNKLYAAIKGLFKNCCKTKKRAQ